MRLKSYLLRAFSYFQGLLARLLRTSLQTGLFALSGETHLGTSRMYTLSGAQLARQNLQSVLEGAVTVLFPEAQEILCCLHS